MNLTDPLSPDSLPTDPDPTRLDEVQQKRTLALAIARPLLGSQTLGSRTPPDVNDLIALATWIIEGSDDSPLYPYADSDGTVHLGPTTWMKPEGFLWSSGTLYEPSTDDGH
jgi:hypothetical protein